MFRHSLVAAMLALLVCPIGCNMPRFQAKRDAQQDIVLQDAKQLIVGSDNGNIKVVAGEPGTVRMLARITANGFTQQEADEMVAELEPEVIHSGSELSISHPKSMPDYCSISFELVVPQDLALALKSSNGAIHVQQIASPVRCETSNGSIQIEGATQSVIAKTSNGKIELKDCVATIDAKTSNGRIAMERCRLIGDSKLRTSNGSIEAHLTNDSPIDIQAGTSNGSINCNVQLDQESKKRTSLSGRAFSSSDKNPVQLELGTSNGSITIKEAASREEPPVTKDPPTRGGKAEIEL